MTTLKLTVFKAKVLKDGPAFSTITSQLSYQIKRLTLY